MPQYKAPLRDYHFCLEEVFDYPSHAGLPGFEDATLDVVKPVLEEGARLSEQVLLPLNQTGDAEGAQLKDGVVTTPKGFKDAFRLVQEGGWAGLTLVSGVVRRGVSALAAARSASSRFLSSGSSWNFCTLACRSSAGTS